jgi:bifunctional non-homologous end joining protein LigD
VTARCNNTGMAGVKQNVEVDGRSLSLSNLDKALYPGNGFTKAQVIDYYIRIAPWMLAHYAKRPVTMKRFPDGVRGKAFYEKDAPKHTPEWVETTEVPRQKGGKPIRYVCVDDLPTLVWCANIASLELHPFLHRAGQLDCPASIVFDLDPGEGADLVTCAMVAFYLRDLLDANGLKCLPKVSGSKGLQLYVPLNTKVSYAQTRSFAQEVAQSLEKRHPKLIVSEMAKNLHGHRSERAYLAAAARLAKDGHIAWVPTERGDVIPYPFESRHKIEYARVSRIGVLLPEQSKIQVAQNVEAVIQTGHDNIAAPAEVFAIVRWLFLS